MELQKKDTMEEYFSGKKLFGDDFTEAQILKWYKDEEEGYANLGSSNKKKYTYQYNSMNQLFGFKYIDKNRRFQNALGFGSAYGHEFLPIINQIDSLTIIEPSDQLRSSQLGTIIPKYIKPNVLGNLDFNDNSFDLIVCFSVLHHIPNVSYVLSELHRILAPNGILLIREPIVSMGDWRNPRGGLTQNERGIPLPFFKNFILENNLKVVSNKYCDSAFMYKSLNKIFGFKHDSKFVQLADKFCSKLFSWNYRYHRKNFFQKITPNSIFLVLKKNDKH